MNGVELVTSWLTPTVLFCVLNLMIGTIYITSNLKPHKNHHNITDENNDDHPPPPQLGRFPSFLQLQRVKSINLSRYQPDPPETTAHYDIPSQEQPAHQGKPDHEPEGPSHVTRSKSHPVAKKKPVLKKSASEKVVVKKREERDDEDHRRPATVREKGVAGGEDEAVDEKADDFIKRFRQQLMLQRLDSILRYKEMLNRGTGR